MSRGRRLLLPARAAIRRLAVVALVGLISGCVTIPTNGPVQDAGQLEGDQGGVLQLLPAGPSAGTTPHALIRDFLRASAAFTNDHEVARSFLIPGERLTWRPASPVVVYSTEEAVQVSVTRGGVTETASGLSPPAVERPDVTASGSAASVQTTQQTIPPTISDPMTVPPRPGEEATITVRVPVQARVDGQGEYRVPVAGDVEVRTFTVVGTSQGWRIASLADGILVSRYDFGTVFRQLPVYFADPTRTYLVPDVRWFPVSGTTSTPSSVVSELLAGPSGWLRSAVITGVVPGTQTTINAVRIVEGTATVDLTEPARSSDTRQRSILRQQLTATLASLGRLGTPVDQIEVTVEQQRFDLQPAPPLETGPRTESTGRPELRPGPSVDSRPVVIDSHGQIARLVGSTAVPVPGLAALAEQGALAPATDAAGRHYAVLSADRSRLWHAVPSGTPSSLLTGTDLIPASFDPFGWVWSAQEQSGGLVFALRPDAGTARVSASWLAGSRLVSLRVSREGARAVVVTEAEDGSPQVFVCGITRTATGVPQELSTPVRLLPDAVGAVAVSWVDETHVMVLARRPGSVEQPWLVELGGDARPTLPISGVWMTAGNSESDLYVQTASGMVRTRLGSGWSDVPGVTWPAMPG